MSSDEEDEEVPFTGDIRSSVVDNIRRVLRSYSDATVLKELLQVSA
jgi:hypothetical protein